MATEVEIGAADFAARQGCSACRSSRSSTIASRTTFSRWESFPAGPVVISTEVADRRRLLRCDACGLWYMSLVPTRQTIRRVLDQPGLEERWTTVSGRQTFRRARNALGSHLAGPGDILDIGAHEGDFLDTLPDGWRKFALEPMARSSGQINGTTVVNQFLEDAELVDRSFDCITAFDILEHLHDPETAMARLAGWLRPGGLLLLETGTTDALAARALHAGWYYLNHLEHLQAFNRTSATGLLERHGLQVLECQRVFHRSVALGQRVRGLAALVAFAGMTLGGRRAGLWRAMVEGPRPAARPPCTGSLEPDHLFIVARRQGPR